MRSDELYKFSDRTLTGLQTSLDDITKNIRMEYLPKRTWSTFEKKRANIIIKAMDKQLKETRMMMSLKKFVEHHSDTKVIHNDDGDPSRANIKQALGRFNTTTENHVKKILLKLNLPDQRSILTDLKRQSVKVKELQERCIIKAFKLSYQEKYEHAGPKSQDYKMARLQDDVKRLCLVDNLKKFKITFISSQRYKSNPKVKDHYNISEVNN
ncbi:hypothetical protein Tco_1546642 [Tanacetum coccineum]